MPAPGLHAFSSDVIQYICGRIRRDFSIRTLDRLRDRMRRLGFRDGRIFQDEIPPVRGLHFGDYKIAFCQSAGLVEYEYPGRIHPLKINRALDQHTVTGCPSDSRKEGKRDRDHQCARAGDDQERQRSVDPDRPVKAVARPSADQRRQDSQDQG